MECHREVSWNQPFSPIYIEDLLEGLQSSGKLFADDAKVYRRIIRSDGRSVLQEDIDRL